MARKPEQATRLHALQTAVERQLLSIIRHGRQAFDGNGHPVLDQDKKPVMMQPTAADISAAIKYLQMTGAVNRKDSGNQTVSNLNELMKRAREKSLPAQQGADSNHDPDSTQPYKFPHAESAS